MGKGARGMAQKGAQIAKIARVAALFAPGTPGFWILIGLGVVILFLLLIMIFFLLFETQLAKNQQHGTVQVHITKTGPAEVKNGENINYSINVDYAGSAEKIIVTDKLPASVDYLSAGGPGNPVYDKNSHTVTWTLTGIGNGGAGSGGGGAVSCSTPAAPANPASAWSDWSCSGIASDKPISSGWYDNTVFGCANGFTDPNDNCEFACNGASGFEQALPECKGLSGPDCERKIKYFAADKDRYGCFAHLQVTNPKTGQSVVVIAIDQGPACNGAELQHNGPIVDLGMDAAKAIGVGGNYELVHVQKVDSSVPVGPVNACK
jgi:hypothetical protein